MESSDISAERFQPLVIDKPQTRSMQQTDDPVPRVSSQSVVVGSDNAPVC